MCVHAGIGGSMELRKSLKSAWPTPPQYMWATFLFTPRKIRYTRCDVVRLYVCMSSGDDDMVDGVLLWWCHHEGLCLCGISTTTISRHCQVLIAWSCRCLVKQEISNASSWGWIRIE